MKKLVGQVKKLSAKNSPDLPSNPGRASLDARARIADIIYEVNSQKEGDLTRVNGSVSESKVEWDAATGSGVKAVGAGAFGAFATVPESKLVPGMKKTPNGIGVKAGEISQDEPTIIKKVGKADLGPKLIAAKVGRFEEDEYGLGIQTGTGLLAMTKVPGTSLHKLNVKQEPIRNAFWESYASLHRLGIAHNDAHNGNILFDRGKVRFVDFGLAQSNPKAALSEALSSARKNSFIIDNGLREGSSFDKIVVNSDKLYKQMVSDGFSPPAVSKFFNSNTRNYSPNFYTEGYWGEMTDAQAKKYIDILYDGI
jgi:serine/threonine protein kinase